MGEIKAITPTDTNLWGRPSVATAYGQGRHYAVADSGIGGR